MIKRILNLYRFTRTERRSIAFLCLILLLVNASSLVFKKDIDIRDSLILPSFDVTKPSNSQSGIDSATKISNSPVAVQNRKQQNPPIDINQADSSGLLELYGIGPVFAGRIVKYRNLLGGYYCCDQLLEVYGMDTLRYKGFRSRIKVSPSAVKRIEVNTSGFKDFLKHPYLEYEDVKKIVRYRDYRGPLSSPELLWTDSVLNPDLKNKLIPYLYIK